MWKLKQSGQFKKDLRKYQNDREKMKSLETVLVTQRGRLIMRHFFWSDVCVSPREVVPIWNRLNQLEFILLEFG